MNKIISSGPQTLLPVTDDYVFAKLFGSEAYPDVLTDLLNAILNGHCPGPRISETKNSSEQMADKCLKA